MDLPDPTRLAFDDVVIDFAGHRVLRDGIRQPLEPKAFGVLALLAQAPGRVFTRDEILDAVWSHRHVTPGVLNRVMTLLRQALGEQANAPRYLHTLHGVGYRFDLPEPVPDVMAAAPMPEPDTAPVSVVPVPVVAQAPMRRASDAPRGFPRWLVVLPLVALLAFAGWNWWPRAAPTSMPAPATVAPAMARSIAVLPLVNASNDREQQFFSDGLSENLINSLSRFDGLKVIGRDSAFLFRDSKDDSRTIGRKLGVSYLLSGSVQRAGDIVRINASLTNAADGSTLWTEHYDRPYQNLFALQDEIASAVASALQAKLLATTTTALSDDRPPSGNLEAYNAYLQGLKDWHDEAFLTGAGHFDKAVQIDPGYAMAWAHLSGSLSTVATNWGQPPAVASQQLRKARLASDRALQLAPTLGPAHAARAYLHFYGFDHRGALTECSRAVQLAPNDATVLNGCGFVLTGIGRLGEAMQLRTRLLSIEPLYTVNAFQYARLLLATGRLDEAEKYLRIAEDLSKPNHHVRMTTALLRGDASAAHVIATQAAADDDRLYLAALAAQIGPDRAAADAALAALLQGKPAAGKAADDHPYQIARVYALRGDAGSAVQWLERARIAYNLFLLADPVFLRVRDDPRFIEFCKKVGLPPPSESEALSIDRIRAQSLPKPGAANLPGVN